MTIKKWNGEYQVGYKGRKKVYFTNDIYDAVSTGIDMAKRNK